MKKLQWGVLGVALLAGAPAMACYTVYDGNGRVVYQGLEAPVDMSLPLHQALAASKFPAGSSLVFDEGAICTPVAIARVARPTGPMAPANTIRIESTGREIKPGAAPAPAPRKAPSAS
ncbi:MAG: hypothetical protein KGL68_13605 [Burkholderiales bacterium]|nr:hypothetical protein [Burkholderiales bacterium]